MEAGAMIERGVSGECHSPDTRNLLIIHMVAMIDKNQINNLLAFIREEDQPVLFCDSR